MDSRTFTPTISFNVIVSNCIVTTFTAPDSPSNAIEYAIGGDTNTAVFHIIPAWTQTNAAAVTCGHAETLTFSPDLATIPWVDIVVSGRRIVLYYEGEEVLSTTT